MTCVSEIFATWRCGANFIPSTAVNQLEMWQADTFDPATIARELGWAANLGMRLMRVYLHDLAYAQDPAGFLRRMEEYLVISDRLKIKTLFVFFDDCWKADFAIGPQPPPVPRKHNSGWLQSPGRRAADDPAEWPRLHEYVTAVMKFFAGDERIAGWDLYNEPGNGSAGNDQTTPGYRGNRSKALLNAVFDWAQNVDHHQPLTAGVWSFDTPFDDLNRLVLDRSELVSFHCYLPPDGMRERVMVMRYLAGNRPLICTEYMARTSGSTFKDCLPILKAHHVSAINWGLVAGKTNTIYPWSWAPEKGEPPLYFHDVFRSDGTMLYESEREIFSTAAGDVKEG